MKFLTAILVVLSMQYNLLAQDFHKLFEKRGEVILKIKVENKSDVQRLSNILSVDKVQDGDVIAYANKKEFLKFLQTGYDYEVLPQKLTKVKMAHSVKDALDWDSYPTYETYVQLMYNFESSYPNLCRIYDAGTTVQGRHILFAVISDNVSQREPEPQFMYTSTMHGDETAGYILMLHLIDYLLSNYRSSAEVRNLINNLEIWINPLANPDGTYSGGNDNVWGSTRYNANWVDLNRNFPDPEDGPHPDGESYQPETQAMMTVANNNNFVMSANFHGGAEVVNYPWDTWQIRHADDSWWQFVSREYADSAHAHSPSGYMIDLNNGITNGYDWYTISGGRQDYMNYFRHCREATIELSSVKTLPESELIEHWNYNRVSLLHYMEQALFGIQGMVSDSSTGQPIAAKITILGHDHDSSQVYSDTTGRFSRPIYAGTYTVQFEAPNYITKTIEVEINNFETTWLDVKLVNPNDVADEDNLPTQFSLKQNYPNPFNPTTTITYVIANPDVIGVKQSTGNSANTNNTKVRLGRSRAPLRSARNDAVNVSLKIYDALGRKIATLVNEKQTAGEYSIQFNASKLPSGIYFYTLRAGNFVQTRKMILMK